MPDCQTEMFLPVPSEVLPPPVLSGSCSSIEPVPAQCDLKQNWRMWVPCVHLFSKATNTTRSLLQVFSKLLLQVSLCYLQVNNRHKLVAEDHSHIKQVLIGSHCFLTPAQPSPTQVLRSIVWLCHQPEPNGKETFCSGLYRDCRDNVPVNMCRLVLGWPHLALEFAFFRLAMKGKPVTTCEAAMPDCQTEMFLLVPSEVLPPPVLSCSCSSIEPVPAQCDRKQNWRMWASCVHLFSKATNTTRSLLQVFSKLLLQVSLCYLQVNNRHKLVAEDHSHIKQVLIGSHCFLTPAQPSPTQVLRSIVWLCHQPEPDGKETFCSGLYRDCRDNVPVNMCRLVLGWPHLALEFAFFRLAMKGKPVTTCEAAMPDCQTEMFLPVPSEVLPPRVLSGSCSSIGPVPVQQAQFQLGLAARIGMPRFSRNLLKMIFQRAFSESSSSCFSRVAFATCWREGK